MAERLLRVQSDFATALRDRGRADTAAAWLAGDAAHAQGRLGLYRANMVAAAEKALSAAYPVIRQVVGDDFFHGLAREHQLAAPSTSGDLGEFGAAFDTFLAQFEHVQDMPWLPDLARVEWAAHRAYGAADTPDWDAASLAAVEPERREAIRLRWSPGLAVVRSTWPVVRVWTLHQPGHEGAFDVDWTVPEIAIVARDGFAVTVTASGAADARFIEASQAGASLGEATADTLDTHPDFDLGALLARAFAARLVCGFTL